MTVLVCEGFFSCSFSFVNTLIKYSSGKSVLYIYIVVNISQIELKITEQVFILNSQETSKHRSEADEDFFALFFIILRFSDLAAYK